MAEIGRTPSPGEEAIRNRYLDSEKKFDLKTHLKRLEKEDKSGLKGIEIRATPKQLGKDDFLKLLITQLSKQDPTNPVKDQDFIAQMAQFSSLEQMKNISTSMQRMEARQSYTLVGKLVSGLDFVSGETVTGIASALFFDSDGKSFVRVNGRTVEVDQINLISDPAILNGDVSENVQDSEKSSQNLKLDSSFSETGRSSRENPNEKNLLDTKEREFPGAKNSKNGY